MTQQSGNDPRMQRIQSRFGGTGQHVPETSPVQQQPYPVQDTQEKETTRKRQSIYASDATMQSITDAYRKATAYPAPDISKSDYFDALIRVALYHEDEIIVLIRSEYAE